MGHEIVASAMTSFNNAALLLPNFMWAAVLMLPVYICVWKLAPEILTRFFPSKKLRDYNFAWITSAVLVLWLVLNRGNWDVIRDGAGLLPYVKASMLFLLVKDVAARLREQNPKVPKFWRSIEPRRRVWIKVGALLAVILATAISVVQEFEFIGVQIAAVMFGIIAGYYRRRGASPVNYTLMMILPLAVAVAMQPEYFRFAQLGRFGLAHSVALLGIFALGAFIFVMRNFKPTGFVRDNHYRYIKWFMRFCCLLMLILFVMTEAVPALLGFFGAVLVTAWFAVKHQTSDVFRLSNNLWALLLFLFGAITMIPLISIVGILAWKNNQTKEFWQSLLDTVK